MGCPWSSSVVCTFSLSCLFLPLYPFSPHLVSSIGSRGQYPQRIAFLSFCCYNKIIMNLVDKNRTNLFSYYFEVRSEPKIMVSTEWFFFEAPGKNLFLALFQFQAADISWLLGSWPHHSDLCFCHHIDFPLCVSSSYLLWGPLRLHYRAQLDNPG